MMNVMSSSFALLFTSTKREEASCNPVVRAASALVVHCCSPPSLSLVKVKSRVDVAIMGVHDLGCELAYVEYGSFLGDMDESVLIGTPYCVSKAGPVSLQVRSAHDVVDIVRFEKPPPAQHRG